MPAVKSSPSRAGATGSRFCRRCGSEIRISSTSALGVVCPACGTTTPTNGLVRGASVTIPRPSELRAFPIGEPEPAASGRSSVRGSAGRGVALSDVLDDVRSAWDGFVQLPRRIDESFDGVRDLMQDWPPRLVLTIAAIAFATGLAVVMVRVLS